MISTGPRASQAALPRKTGSSKHLPDVCGDLKPEKTIICIGGYGYDWPEGGEATDVTFQEAMLSARDSDVQVKFDQTTLNPYFRYEEDDGFSARSHGLLDG